MLTAIPLCTQLPPEILPSTRCTPLHGQGLFHSRLQRQATMLDKMALQMLPRGGRSVAYDWLIAPPPLPLPSPPFIFTPCNVGSFGGTQ